MCGKEGRGVAKDGRVLLTGGAGYLGSHLCGPLVDRGHSVRVLDNLSTGRRESLAGCEESPGFEFHKADLLRDPLEKFLEDCETVVHLAANQDVRRALTDTGADFHQNVEATYRLLEAMRVTGPSRLIFTSTSTVYGEADVVPTPEDYAPLAPISLYGATKLAGEAMISAFAHTYGLQALVFRLANVVGGRSTHGVVYDLVQKLRQNDRELEIIGRDPGTRKSYVHVEDVMAGILQAWNLSNGAFEVYNLGSEDQINVREVADSITSALGLSDVEDGRGWKGDVREMGLDVSKLEGTGWRPRLRSGQAVRQAANDLLDR
jgi:UDP-glucose 4-epimerase